MNKAEAITYLRLMSDYSEEEIVDITKDLKDPEDLSTKFSCITLTNSAADTIEEAIYFLKKLFDAIPAEAESDLYLLSETLTNLKIVKNRIEDEEGYEKIYKLRPNKKEGNNVHDAEREV